jgi:hypothetical protein
MEGRKSTGSKYRLRDNNSIFKNSKLFNGRSFFTIQGSYVYIGRHEH